MSAEVIDVSLPVSSASIVWPSAPAPSFQRRLSIDRGDAVNDSNVFMNAHTGTHIDAPLHHFADGEAADAAPLDALIGDAWVLSIPDVAEITPERLARAWPASGAERVLLQTRNSRLWAAGFSEFTKDFCALTAPAAEWLVSRGVRLVGIDYLSVQRFHDSNAVHQVLLGAKVVLLEGLDLSTVRSGNYELLCLPIKLVGIEAAPARVVLRSTART
jgi:arylformamidase